jgi:hypothetical protein
MSEFGKLKDDAEQYAKDHPEQVRKAGQGTGHAVEEKLGLGGEQGPGNPQTRGQDGNQGSSQSDDRQ